MLDWFNADLFIKGFSALRTTDERVDLLNNYWQQLWRSVAATGQTLPQDVAEKLDADMANWWDWRTRYYDAIFRRAVDPRDLWGSGLQTSYEKELGAWKDRYLADLELVLQVVPEAEQELIRRQVDPEIAFQEYPTASGGSPWPFYVGLGAVVLLVGAGAYFAFRTEGYRKSQPGAYSAKRKVVSTEPRHRDVA